MSATFAQTFGDRLRTDFVEANFSKYDQTLLTDFDPAPDAICIFAQEFVDPPYHTHHMDYPTLIDAVIAAKGDRVVHIKIHPKQSKAGRFNLLGYHDPAGGVFVTDHSIHGLLPTASVAISLSSAVLLEAQMHHVPGIVAGQVDFGHNMIIVADPVQISGAIDQATTQTFAYDKFLAFFFAQNMVQPKLKAKARAKIGAVLDRMKGVY